MPEARCFAGGLTAQAITGSRDLLVVSAPAPMYGCELTFFLRANVAASGPAVVAFDRVEARFINGTSWLAAYQARLIVTHGENAAEATLCLKRDAADFTDDCYWAMAALSAGYPGGTNYQSNRALFFAAVASGTSSPTPTPSLTPSPRSDAANAPNAPAAAAAAGPPLGAIVGGAAGGVLLLAGVAAALLCRRRSAGGGPVGKAPAGAASQPGPLAAQQQQQFPDFATANPMAPQQQYFNPMAPPQQQYGNPMGYGGSPMPQYGNPMMAQQNA